MTKKDIHVIPHKDGWATKKEGSQRAGIVVDMQKAAIDRVEVVIHRKDGTIRDSDSYDNEPNSLKDKKNWVSQST